MLINFKGKGEDEYTEKDAEKDTDKVLKAIKGTENH